MTRLNVMEARKVFGDTVNRVAYRGERIVLERRGIDVAALVPVEDLRLLERVLEELEDLLDVEEAEKALHDPVNAASIPWKDVKKRLGL